MLRHKRNSRTSRPGFTLMELMVSVAILLAVLAMIGTIFSTASKAGGNATAITTVYRQLRQAGELIRQDLANMDPKSDTLGIAGVLVNGKGVLVNTKAVGTGFEPDRRAESVEGFHRADVMMLTTNRTEGSRPYVYDMGAYDPDAWLASKVQVVYGHADLGHMDPVSGSMSVLKRIEDPTVSQIPATNWHLARRTLFFPAGTTLNPASPGVADGLMSNDALFGLADICSVPYTNAPWMVLPSGFYHYLDNTSYNGALGYAYESQSAQAFQYDATSGNPSPKMFYDGVQWNRFEGGTWVHSVGGPPAIAPAVLPAFVPTWEAVNIQGNGPPGSLARQWFYSGDPTVNRRTILDEHPPRNYAGLLGPQFLPNCSDFRVEYTYDDPRETQAQFTDPLNVGPAPRYSDFVRPVRWQAVIPGEQLIWSKLSVSPQHTENRPPVVTPFQDRTDPHRWPRAIRITLKAWDSGGRLQEPVTYTVMHCWASGD